MVVVSLMQFLNIFSIYDLLGLIIQKKLHIGKWTILIIIILLIFLNSRRYYKFDYTMLKDKWAESEGKEKTKKGYLIVLYIVASTVICVALTIYVGSKNW